MHPHLAPLVRVLAALSLAALALAAGAAAGGATERVPAPSPDPAAITARVRAYHRAHAAAIVGELAELLRLPNVAADREAMRRNAELLLEMLRRRGFASRLLEVDGAPAAVFGELAAPGAERTVIFYCHYDGQPVDPRRWASPPWEPVLRDGPLEAGGRELPLAGPFGSEARLYARSASDDKGPIVALLAALDALRAAGVPPSVHLKLFLDGEEEAGSPHLAEILARHAPLLAADAWIFADGPVDQTRRPLVAFGVRGVVGLEATVFGSLRELHSGHYGNWAPNPAALLAGLVASLRSPDGEILIPGFYDDVRPPTAADREALAAAPEVESALARDLGLARTEGAGARLGERLLLPALNVRGLAAGAVGGEARNAIPTTARASIDFRLVPDQTPEGVRQRVEEFLAGRGWTLVAAEPDLAARRAHPALVRLEWGDGYRAVRTPLDAPFSRAVLAVVDAAGGEPAVRVPSFGGSLPLYLFEEALGAPPLVVVPMVNHDNNQHAPNENLRLANLFDGIELYASLIARLGSVWEETD